MPDKNELAAKAAKERSEPEFTDMLADCPTSEIESEMNSRKSPYIRLMVKCYLAGRSANSEETAYLKAALKEAVEGLKEAKKFIYHQKFSEALDFASCDEEAEAYAKKSPAYQAIQSIIAKSHTHLKD